MQDDEKIILEKDVRLSESILWKLQSAAYCQFGPHAWSEKGVPFYLTSNPFTAKQYALITAGFFRDCVVKDAAIPIDVEHSVYILDLGAGTGRFGYLYLKILLDLLGVRCLQKIKVRYVMTDFAESNISFLREHPYLQPFIRQGILDFAFYNYAQKEEVICLLESKDVLSAESVVNPLIIIGNYFFDTIPQDLFRVNHGQLEEGKITLKVDRQRFAGPISFENPDIINHLESHYSYCPLNNSEEYYSNFPEANEILLFYHQRFDNIPFLFPKGAFESLRYFSKISNKRMLLLAGDQGVSTEQQIKTWGEPKIALHGSFSLSVSYHAIALYFRMQGGFGLLTTHSNPMFAVIAAGLGGRLEYFSETRLSFSYNMDFFEPTDYFFMITYTEKEWRNPSLEYLLLLLKLGNWDPMNLNSFFNAIRSRLPNASNELKLQLAQAIHRVWENFYPVSKAEGDFLFNLGVIYFEMEMYSDALIYFQRSIDLSGDRGDAFINMAKCYKILKRPAEALACLEKAEKLKSAK